MAQPAIYVVVRDGGWFHAGHNIAGYEVDQVLALGPEVSMRYVEGLIEPDDADEPNDATAGLDMMIGHLGGILRRERDDDPRVVARQDGQRDRASRLLAMLTDPAVRQSAARPEPPDNAASYDEDERLGFWGENCTAGALIDHDGRTLLLFTDMLDLGARGAFLDGLTRTC